MRGTAQINEREVLGGDAARIWQDAKLHGAVQQFAVGFDLKQLAEKALHLINGGGAAP